MDYDKLIERLKQHSVACVRTHGRYCSICDDAALAIETLREENAKLQSDWEKYQPREHRETLNEAVDNLRADLARVTAERDAAVADMEALMWFGGEGCRICAHAVEVHKEPYVRLDCDREKETDCSPKWRGIKKED